MTAQMHSARLVTLAALAGCIVAAAAARADGGAYQSRNFTNAPAIDGILAEWASCPVIEMKQPNVPDLRVELASLGWDTNALYLAVRVTDGTVVNRQPLDRLQDADCVELRIGAPDGARDAFVRVCLAPASLDGKPACAVAKHAVASKRETPLVATTESTDKSGVRWAVAREDKAWNVEAAIPFALLGGAPKLGAHLPFVLVVWDRDRADVNEWDPWHKRSESSSQKAPMDQWPSLELAGTNVFATKPAPPLAIARHRPCNLFEPGEDVVLETALKGFPEGAGELAWTLRDAFGKEVARRSLPVTQSGAAATAVTLNLGKPGRGYYELALTATVRAPDGQATAAAGKATLGVMELVHRSAADVRAQDYRFGLKWWGGVIDKPETLDMMAKLGLQWSRIILAETPSIVTNFPLNAVIKIERFPKELYDEARYGKLEEWEQKFGRGAWTLKTLPRKAPYQQYLAEGLAQIPKSQNVFEIWNEPWDKMSPEDFATISQWIAEVVRKDRPDAILGQNLRGDMSGYGYDAKVAKAGGLQGMNMVCLHPYGASEDRAWLREYRAWISKLAGHDMPIYVTEYGTHSCPAGPAKKSELEQARAVVRQSLALYAEDVKALIPHWVGQSEANPTYHEDWFGYIRHNQEPKPVLLAHANSARLIDSGRYVGDLWLGPGVAAMLFEKAGVRTLALWTRGEETNVVLAAGVPSVVLTDMFGAEETGRTADGALALRVGPDVRYVTGLPAALDAQASRELRADRWPAPAVPVRQSRSVHKLAAPPALDGTFGDWKGATQLALMNPKVSGDDASGTGYLAWDDQFLYVGVAMRDNEMLNTRPRAKLYQQDSLELFVSTEPRDGNPGYGPHDHQYFGAPTSGEGGAVFGLVADREAGKVTDVPGARVFAGKEPAGWTMQVAVPWSTLPDFAARPGAKAALDLRVNDSDTSHERWKIDPIDGNPMPEMPTVWPLLLLAE